MTGKKRREILEKSSCTTVKQQSFTEKRDAVWLEQRTKGHQKYLLCLDYLISPLYLTCSRPTDCHAASKTQQSSLEWPSRYLHASLLYFLQISAQIRFHQKGLFPRSNKKWPTLVNSINFHPFGLLYLALLSHDMLIVYFLLIET